MLAYKQLSTESVVFLHILWLIIIVLHFVWLQTTNQQQGLKHVSLFRCSKPLTHRYVQLQSETEQFKLKPRIHKYCYPILILFKYWPFVYKKHNLPSITFISTNAHVLQQKPYKKIASSLVGGGGIVKFHNLKTCLKISKWL